MRFILIIAWNNMSFSLNWAYTIVNLSDLHLNVSSLGLGWRMWLQMLLSLPFSGHVHTLRFRMYLGGSTRKICLSLVHNSSFLKCWQLYGRCKRIKDSVHTAWLHFISCSKQRKTNQCGRSQWSGDSNWSLRVGPDAFWVSSWFEGSSICVFLEHYLCKF